MDAFWAEAAAVLKPGGSVALWTLASLYCRKSFFCLCSVRGILIYILHTFLDPCTPNAAEVQRILFHLEREVLAPFELPPNRLSRDMYDNLPLPWNVTPPVTAFSESDFVRYEWDCNGNEFFGQSEEVSLDDLGRTLPTASMVTR
jgi:hypothetical protein